MTKSKIISISLITALLISGIFFFFYFKHKITSIKNLRASIESLYTTATPDVEAPKGLTGLKQLFPQNSGTTEFIEKAFLVSKKYSIKDLLVEYKNREKIELGTGKQLIASRTPGRKTTVIYAYPIKLNFTSGYRNMAEFIQELQGQERLVTIKSLKAEKEKGHLSVELFMDIYSTEER